MRFFRFFPIATALTAAGSFLLLASIAQAAEGTTGLAMPTLLAKNWLLGYALVFLCVLLGLLAVLIPSMRKVLRRKD